MIKAKEIIKIIEQEFPASFKIGNDPIGIQIGSPQKNISKILTTLDVRPAVVDEAINLDVDFIFSHHPVWFKPLKNFDLQNPQVQMYEKLIKNNIMVYSAHTNFDCAPNGMNKVLSDRLGLTNRKILVKEAVQYSDDNIGLGIVGDLPQALKKEDFINSVKSNFRVKHLRYVNSAIPLIRKVALIGGDGGKFFPEVIKSEADAFITGDLYYHTAQDIEPYNLLTVDPGHNIEKFFAPTMKDFLRNKLNKNVDVLESNVDTEPFTFE